MKRASIIVCLPHCTALQIDDSGQPPRLCGDVCHILRGIDSVVFWGGANPLNCRRACLSRFPIFRFTAPLPHVNQLAKQIPHCKRHNWTFSILLKPCSTICDLAYNMKELFGKPATAMDLIHVLWSAVKKPAKSGRFLLWIKGCRGRKRHHGLGQNNCTPNNDGLGDPKRAKLHIILFPKSRASVSRLKKMLALSKSLQPTRIVWFL